METKPLILIVDNNHNEAENLITILEKKYETIAVYNVKDALSIFESLHMKIRIVLLNINIGDGGGVDLLKSMKKRSLLPEIVVFSDYEDIQQSVEAIKEGAYDFLITPFDDKSLLITLEKVFENLDIDGKLEEFTRKGFLDQISDLDIDKRLIVANKLILKRRLEGKAVTQEEIFTIFSPKDKQKSFIFNQIKEILNKEAIEEDRGSEKPTVLIIEDDDDTRRNLEKLLKGNYDIHLAATSTEALTLLEEIKAIDVVLLDVYLQDTTGIDLLPKIKKIRDDVEVIIMTAYREISVVVQTLKEGACDYISKPFLKVDILTTIGKALQRKYVQNVLPKIRRKLIERIPDSKKMAILSELYKIRKREEKLLRMGDIYAFFPELKQVQIPEDFVLPNHITDGGIVEFVEKMKSSIQMSAAG
jgi:DNA-binding NtrC family response regulator